MIRGRVGLSHRNGLPSAGKAGCLSYFARGSEAQEKNNSHDEIGSIVGEEMHFINKIDDDIAQIQNRLLGRQAEKHLIPFPKHITKDGTWEQSNISGRWRLSQKAISELKNAIRQEQKDRREKWQGWLALLIGFVGALIGLLSVL